MNFRAVTRHIWFLIFSSSLLLISCTTYSPPEIKVLETPSETYTLTLKDQNLELHKNTDRHLWTWCLKADEDLIDVLVAQRTPTSKPTLLMIVGSKGTLHGNRFEIWSLPSEGSPILETSESMEGMNPWKLQTADVNGDGIEEISITMYKKTKFHPEMADRPYLYTWNTKAIEPLWRGSCLSRPFQEYTFADLNQDGKDELISVEFLQDNTQVIQAYAMIGFGFEGIAQSQPYQNLSHLKKNIQTQSLNVDLIDETGTHCQTIAYQGEQLSLTPCH